MKEIKEREYRFEDSFFGVSLNEGMFAFKSCFNHLEIPVKVAVIYDDDSPAGRVVVSKKEGEPQSDQQQK